MDTEKESKESLMLSETEQMDPILTIERPLRAIEPLHTYLGTFGHQYSSFSIPELSSIDLNSKKSRREAQFRSNPFSILGNEKHVSRANISC